MLIPYFECLLEGNLLIACGFFCELEWWEGMAIRAHFHRFVIVFSQVYYKLDLNE